MLVVLWQMWMSVCLMFMTVTVSSFATMPSPVGSWSASTLPRVPIYTEDICVAAKLDLQGMASLAKVLLPTLTAI